MGRGVGGTRLRVRSQDSPDRAEIKNGLGRPVAGGGALWLPERPKSFKAVFKAVWGHRRGLPRPPRRAWRISRLASGELSQACARGVAFCQGLLSQAFSNAGCR